MRYAPSLACSVLALSWLSAPSRADESKNGRPLHVIIITADDMNADSSGWMGSKLGATPNLDKFATGCHRFIHCHVSAPICQPSRSALMTGRVPHRNGALGFHPIRDDVTTLIDILTRMGYFTAVINKFEHMMPVSRFAWNLKLGGSGKNPAKMAEHVRLCLKSAAEAKKPIFLNANITDPHRPFPGGDPPKKKKQIDTAPVKAFSPEEVMVPAFLEDIPPVRKEIAQYYTAVRRFDESFGAIITALAEAGVLDQALVIFLSDHGMSFPFSKATVYRNGTWSPVLMRWPAMGMPREDRLHMLSSVDVLPTVLDVLGAAPQADVDGRSWLPLLRGKEQRGRDHVVTHVNTVNSGLAFPGRCVRTLTRSYIWHAWPGGETKLRMEAMNGITFKALAEAAEADPKLRTRVQQYHSGVVHGFYNLESDPDERRNLYDDASQRDEITRLKNLLLAHMERTQDPQLDNYRKALKR